MTRWTRVTVTEPIFTKGSKKGKALRVGDEWMAPKRYISPTEMWMERLPSIDQFVLSHQLMDTPFLDYLKGD